MPLPLGSRLGAYEIVAPLGAGGMGEVYRARDLRLNRDVAIKVLSAHLTGDPTALARFEREAQAVAALSHPNILAIHDFGTSGNVTYTVTELLEGETLRARLTNSALPTRKAIEYGIQIVRGIAAAHERGIIHRDLKPENIFLTRDGVVKILDFGLAKTTGASAEEKAHAETQLGADTAPGTVLGTVGYMSPEQVRGLAVDQRTDIFSFGSVFYEMLAGRRAFRGNSHVETMNAILKEDPPELSTVNATLPASLDRIVGRCLEKEAADRFHSAHDLAIALEAVSGSSHTNASAVAAVAAPAAARRRVSLAVTLGLVAAGAGAAFVAGRFTTAPPASLPEFTRLSFRQMSISYAHFVAGSDTVAFSGRANSAPASQIFTMHLSGPDALELPFPGAQGVSISSKGELAIISNRRVIAGYSTVGTLGRAPLSGGAARAVLENVQDADWLPDGSDLVVADFVDGRYRLEFPIGQVIYSTGGWISHPRVSPDGSHVAFLEHPLMGDDRGSVMLVDKAGHPTSLSPAYASVQGLAWSPSGHEVWFTGTGTGNARVLQAATLAGHVRSVLRVPGSLLLNDIAADGRVLLTEIDERQGTLGLRPGETTERDLSALDYSVPRSLSADGQTVLISEEGDGGGPGYGVYIRPTDGAPPVRLGTGDAFAISPDGRWVIAARLEPAPAQLVLMPTGVGQSRPLTNDSITHVYAAFLPDGKRFIVFGHEPGKATRAYVQSVSGGPAQPVTPEGVVGFPTEDGTQLVGVDTDGQTKLFPLAGGAATVVKHDPVDTVRSVLTTGDLLVSRPTTDGGFDITRVNPATGGRTILHHIAPRPGGGRPGTGSLNLTPDGRGYVYSYSTQSSTLYLVTGLK